MRVASVAQMGTRIAAKRRTLIARYCSYMSVLPVLNLLAVMKGLLDKLSRFLMRVWGKAVFRNPVIVWRIRLHARKVFDRGSAEHCRPKSLVDCHVSFINLTSREDRLVEFRAEFERLGLPIAHRFEAVEMENGALGAAKSHYGAVAAARARRPGEIIGVCEDDLQFLVSRKQIEDCYAEFAETPSIDVLCLAFMNKNSTHKKSTVEVEVGNTLAISNNIMTMSCYFLKPRAIGPVLQSLETSAKLLERGFPWRYAAGDVYWQRLQQGKLTFAVPSLRVARQRAGFSTIYQHYKDVAV